MATNKKSYYYSGKCSHCGLGVDFYYGEETHTTEQEFIDYMSKTKGVIRQKYCPHCKTDSYFSVVSYTVKL